MSATAWTAALSLNRLARPWPRRFVSVDEPTERLAFALAGSGGLHEDTVTFSEQRAVGLHRIEAGVAPSWRTCEE
ncbi:hypothetical protein GCM10023191_053760 [Actinoallomurus oryzae]|uniref:Uncharacterized protein n=1 Tax=Actinoallomurus oryzae TaxID=502180 RepID=A0ABP8QGU1_9ACTN